MKLYIFYLLLDHGIKYINKIELLLNNLIYIKIFKIF